MLNQQTLNKLFVMRLNGMADAFRQQLEQTGLGELSFEERFGMLVDRHGAGRKTARFRAVCGHRDSRAQLRWKTSITRFRAAWTARCCAV